MLRTGCCIIICIYGFALKRVQLVCKLCNNNNFDGLALFQLIQLFCLAEIAEGNIYSLIIGFRAYTVCIRNKTVILISINLCPVYCSIGTRSRIAECCRKILARYIRIIALNIPTDNSLPGRCNKTEIGMVNRNNAVGRCANTELIFNIIIRKKMISVNSKLFVCSAVIIKIICKGAACRNIRKALHIDIHIGGNIVNSEIITVLNAA